MLTMEESDKLCSTKESAIDSINVMLETYTLKELIQLHKTINKTFEKKLENIL